MSVEDDSPRNGAQAMRRGFVGRCPACGRGRLFGRFLKVEATCAACGEAMHHHRADDFPAYATMFLVGHVLIGLMVLVIFESNWPNWLHMMIWPALAVGLTLVLIQPIKGAIVGLQWALRMHGFASTGHHSATDPERAG
jgi:uncharacterized protein (DUF983 family)